MSKYTNVADLKSGDLFNKANSTQENANRFLLSTNEDVFCFCITSLYITLLIILSLLHICIKKSFTLFVSRCVSLILSLIGKGVVEKCFWKLS